MRLPKHRPQTDKRSARKRYDHAQVERERERAWLEATRYRVTL